MDDKPTVPTTISDKPDRSRSRKRARRQNSSQSGIPPRSLDSSAGILATYAGIDPKRAKIILAGMAVLTAAFLLAPLRPADEYWKQLVGYLFAFVVLLYVIEFMLSNRHMKMALGWFVVLLIIVWGSVVSAAMLFEPIAGRIGINNKRCILQPQENCEDLLNRLARRDPPAPVPVPDAPTIGIQENAYRVAVRFAGVINRDDLIAVRQRLRSEGWNLVELPERGGVLRTAAAAGLNEVRYGSPKERAAAERLRREFQSAQLVNEPIDIKEVPHLEARLLEVWISR
jgi:hypothetical protein